MELKLADGAFGEVQANLRTSFGGLSDSYGDAVTLGRRVGAVPVNDKMLSYGMLARENGICLAPSFEVAARGLQPEPSVPTFASTAHAPALALNS